MAYQQRYPRINDETSKEYGMLDVSQLVDHRKKFSREEMAAMIKEAIYNANLKSSRATMTIPNDADEMVLNQIYKKEGQKLFQYFKKYCGDPASTAHQLFRKSYRDVAVEQFRTRAVQRGRMNSGWRYQFLLLECATNSLRFKRVSDLGSEEADFNAVVEQINPNKKAVNLYVSVKNRKNTLGGQDWPKAIHALENVAQNDKNRTGPYCCIFGIAMDKGQRYVKIQQKTKQPHSINTEVWLSDFLWPFFANYSYDEVMSVVLDVLLDNEEADDLMADIEVPELIVDSFGLLCQRRGLVDDNGLFHNPHKLVQFFCS